MRVISMMFMALFCTACLAGCSRNFEDLKSDLQALERGRVDVAKKHNFMPGDAARADWIDYEKKIAPRLLQLESEVAAFLNRGGSEAKESAIVYCKMRIVNYEILVTRKKSLLEQLKDERRKKETFFMLECLENLKAGRPALMGIDPDEEKSTTGQQKKQTPSD